MKQNTGNLSRADINILEELQGDSRITVSELAERVSLSDSPCWRRWKKLEQDGYITGYHASLDRKKLGLQVVGFSQVRLSSHHPSDTEKFEAAVNALSWVITCFCIAGDADYIVQIVAYDLDQYYERVSELRKLPSVFSIQSSIGIKEVKNTHRLPI